MGLIIIENIEDGQDASANGLNERFGKIADEINGNIDTANLKNNAVTREKIAAQSITSDKLLVEREYDENGWLVTDYGGYKRYSRTGSFNESVPGNYFGYKDTGIAFPAGLTFTDIVGSWVGVNDQAISIGFSTYYNNKVAFNVQNKYGSAAPLNGTWNITLEK